MIMRSSARSLRIICGSLSRTPRMDDALYEELLQRLSTKGFDITRLEKNPQRPMP